MQLLSEPFQKNLFSERDVLESAHLGGNASLITSGYIFSGEPLHLSEPSLPYQ